MKALVTGATGGLGRNLVAKLREGGHHVIAVGRNASIGESLRTETVRFAKLDLMDFDGLKKLVSEADTVFHCAALSSPWGRRQDFWNANVVGTCNVVEACLRNGMPRLVHVSSPSIYFDFMERHGISEDDPLPRRQANLYSQTKLQAEGVVDRAVKEHGLQAVTIRPRAIFGPHDTTLMPRIIAASRGGFVPLINGGNALVDVTYVDNVVDSMMLAASAGPHAVGRKYNITNGEPIRLRTLLEKAFTALGLPFKSRNLPYLLVSKVAWAMEMWASLPLVRTEPTITRYTAGVFALGQTLDISRARKDLGYAPAVSIEEGIRLYAEWHGRHGN